MNIYSDPVVQFHDPSVVCSVCGEPGHTKLSCLYSRAEDLANMSHEDRVFWSYIHPSDRPEGLVESDHEHHMEECDQEESIGDSDQEESVEESDQEESMDGSDLEEPMIEENNSDNSELDASEWF